MVRKAPVQIEFNARDFLYNEIGIPREAIELFARFGITIKPRTMQQWYLRNSIPKEHWPVLIFIAQRAKKPINVAPYLKVPKRGPRKPRVVKPYAILEKLAPKMKEKHGL